MVEGGLIIAGLANFILGVVVFLRDRRNSSNLFFLLLTMSVAIWCWGIAAFMANNNIDISLVYANIYYLAALGIGVCLPVFAYATIEETKLRKHYIHYAVIYALAVIALLIYPHSIVKEFVIDSDGDKVASFNVVGQTIYSIVFIALFSRALLLLTRESRTAVGQRKSQLQYIALGVTIAGVVGLIFNLILPWFSVYEYIWVGPISSVFFVGFVGYSIAKHKLFNLRATAARGFAYLLSLGSIISLYTLIVYVLSSVDVVAENLSTLQRVAFASIAVISGLFYEPARRFFNRVTNKLFYRDAYDAQTLMDDLNSTLVNSVELDNLLESSAKIIQYSLKSSFIGFYIRETSYTPSRLVATDRKLSSGDLESIRQHLPLLNTKIYTLEDSTSSSEEKILADVLRKNDIQVLGRLVTSVEYKVAGVGYMILGPKLSGEVYSTQDLRVLETILNELVIAVENSLRFEEIENFNVTLQKKIDNATKELKENNEKLKALDIAKDEFVSMASHQLRTPLTSIKGYISMVLEGDAGEITPTQKKMLGQAYFSSQRMVYLISDLLNISRLRTGKFLIETKPVDLAELVESELKQLEEGAFAKNITMTFKKPKKFPILELDDMKIRQVVMNFIDNALYYTPQDGKITVNLKDKPRSVEFTVTDSGIGVPKNEQHKLFTKFYRAENARKARPDGTGIGLFMAKKIIATSGGSIIFNSKEGKGSTFGFTFPKKTVKSDG